MRWLNRVMLRLHTGNILDRRSLVKTLKLKEISELKTGPFGTQFSAKEYVSEGIPVINVKNIGYGKIISEGLDYVGNSTLERLSEHKLKTGDIVFGRKGSVDRHCLITKEQNGWMQGSDCIRVRLTDESVYSNFISYYLLTDAVKTKINNSAVGSTMASLNSDILGDVDINLPGYEEQYKIASVLSTIDQKIEKNKEINDYLEQQLQLLYDYWFTQYNFPNEDGQPYKASNGLMVWNKMINHLIPADWKVNPLSTICSFRNGVNYDKNVDGNTIYKIINVRNISSSTLFLDESNFDEICLPKQQGDKYCVSDESIIIARSGIPGATRILCNPGSNIIFCGFIICCTPYDDTLQNYLTLYLRQFEGSSATQTGGSILKNVSQETLKNLIVPIPPQSLLNQFNDSILPIYNLINSNTKENVQLITLRDWLLPMLMNGQATIED